jgi:hypothetical protein
MLELRVKEKVKYFSHFQLLNMKLNKVNTI